MHEIERKFLVTQPLRDILSQHGKGLRARKRIEQRYLDRTGDWTIRVRKVTQHGEPTKRYLTMKKKVTELTCVEVENEIDAEFYEVMVAQCGIALRKTRYEIWVHDHLWEIDAFDDFDGLVVAELELKDENDRFLRPDWLGAEVTADKAYRNRQMVKALEKREKEAVAA